MNVAKAINAACQAQRDRDLLRWAWSSSLTYDQRMACRAFLMFGWPIITPNIRL